MIRTIFLRNAWRLAIYCLLGLFFCELFAQPASADIVWTINPSQTSASMEASLIFPAWDRQNPEHPNPDSDFYVPPIVIKSSPQIDVGTSGDPNLPNPVNSTVTTGTGYFKTVGANFLTSVNFGKSPDNISKATFVVSNNGNWLPNQVDPSGGTANGSAVPIQAFGAATPANAAVTMTRVSPTSGYDAASLTYSDFSQASTDVGRMSIYGIKGVPFADSPLPVANGVFDASSVGFYGQFGLVLNLVEKSLYPGLYNPEIVTAYPPANVPPNIETGELTNILTGSAAKGVITRSGPDYIMTLPFSAIKDFDALSSTVSLHLVAKANIILGDVNFDGAVNSADRILVQSHLGQTNPNHLGVGDANGDGVVNGADLLLVPEPATLVLACAGVAMLLALRARRLK